MKVKEILEVVKPIWVKNERYEENNPKVTVILPTFKRAKSGYFEKAVESVMAQSYKDWELIIVDDASTDGTEDLIKFYMGLDKRISTIRHTYNLGLPSISEYEGYKKARGEYIAFIFDDNIWNPDHLLLSIKAMIKNDVKVTCGTTESYYEEDNFITLLPDLSLVDITNSIGNGTVVMHRSVVETCGLYDPHVSLTRLCDWDLWMRISRSFKIHIIPAVLTTEKGTMLSDSLGNSIKMNSWIAAEQIAHDRNKQLNPINFEEYDIADIHDDSTELFLNHIKEYYNSYKKKKWFVERSFDISITNPRKRVLVALADPNASYYLGIGEIAKHSIVRVCLYTSLMESDVVWADSVIHFRNPVFAEKHGKMIKKYHIPAYFYLDDNYWALLGEGEDIVANDVEIIKTFCEKLTPDLLKEYKGFIVSTNELAKVIEKKGLHRNIIVLPPTAGNVDSANLSIKDNVFNIAFVGGGFRENTFKTYVYPALMKLSKQYKIKLICTDKLAKKISEYYDDCEEIVIDAIDYNTNFNQFICNLSNKNINILIHTGEEIKNNKYKTCNALINAVRMGAILIASDIDPYRNNHAIVTSKNTEDGWYEKLKQYFENPDEISKQFEKCKNFVDENYSSRIISKKIDEILADVENASATTIMERINTALFLKDLNPPSVYSSNINQIIVSSGYEFIDKLLSYSALTHTTEYKIVANNAVFSSIGFLFSSDYEEFKGTLNVKLYDKGKLLGESTMNIADLKLRELNYFDFGNIINAPRVMKVVISANYEKNVVGVYENSSKRHFIYKVINKLLHKKLLIKNLVYFDLK